MTETAVIERVQALVIGIAGPDRTPPAVGPDTPLVHGGFWLDSVSLLEVVIACEVEFGVVFDSATDLTADAFDSVRSLGRLIARRRC